MCKEGGVFMYVMLMISIAFAAMSGIVFHKAPTLEKNRIFKFNFFGSLVWIAVLFALCGFKVSLSVKTLMWGLAYGVVQALFILFKNAAMKNGPVSVTTLIGNCSLLVSLFASLLLWDEKISLFQFFGLVLLTVSIVLCVYKRSEGKFTRKWGVLAFFFLLLAASVGLLFKAFSKYGDTAKTADMMLVSAIVMAVFHLSMVFLTKGDKKLLPDGNAKEKGYFLLLAASAGLLGVVYNRLNIYLSGVLPAAVFFTGFNGGTVILSSVLGILFCRERLSIRQSVGMLMGVFAIIAIGIF